MIDKLKNHFKWDGHELPVFIFQEAEQ